MMFKLQSPFQPTGDQPAAIAALTKNLRAKVPWQVLLGVTGSGKTFTMANVIAAIQRPTLIIVHNKTLAAQLWSEFREFFPHNAVHYFVSYYDYYQPEAYVAATDTYIEKDLEINAEIDRLRHAATHALLTRRDVIIVATVSCLFGLGSPELYLQAAYELKVGSALARAELLHQLTDRHYERHDLDFRRGRFRARGDTVDVWPADGESFYRLAFDFDHLSQITERHPVTGKTISQLNRVVIFPAKHYVSDASRQPAILHQIEQDLATEAIAFESQGKLVEAQRLRQRVRFDLEMRREIGTVKGIENYSRYFDGRAIGTPPHVLLDFFPHDYLLFIDESHVTLPQISAMHGGDRSRKQSLIDHGFRLQAAYDNRPLTGAEFDQRHGPVIAVSATPGELERERARGHIVEQLIRPTGLLDPEVEVRPTENQIDDLIAEITARVARGQRTLVTTLTKKMTEELTDFLAERKIKVQYLHADVATSERSEILADLRRGTYDVVVGINLLREGLDLPEVSLVAILDADKEGFLRSFTSLIQTFGRAARHEEGRVIMYADAVTDSMRAAMAETKRRRHTQAAYNQAHGLTPQGIRKEVLETGLSLTKQEEAASLAESKRLSCAKRALLIEDLKEQMTVAAANLDFEAAAKLRDRVVALSAVDTKKNPSYTKKR